MLDDNKFCIVVRQQYVFILMFLISVYYPYDTQILLA